MKVELTKELKIELLESLKRGYLDTEKLDELTGVNKNLNIDIDEEKLKQIEKILYPD